MTEIYPFIGVTAVVSTWIIIGIVLRKSNVNVRDSVSQHAALSPRVQSSYSIFMTLALFAFAAYVLLWLVPEFRLGSLFTVIFVLGFISQVAAAWLPDTKQGTLSKLHELCAYGAAALMLVLATLLVFSSSISGLLEILYVSVLAVMVAFTFLYQFVKKSREQYLWFQITYIVLFQLALIAPAITVLV